MVKWFVDKSKERSKTKIMYRQNCAEREEENTKLFSFITWSTEHIFILNYKHYTHYYLGPQSEWTEWWWWWR